MNKKPLTASKKSTQITSFKVMDILEHAKTLEEKGKEIIHFEVGEPEFKTPLAASTAGINAIKNGFTKYTHSMGVLELRKEICRKYKKRYGVKVEPEQIIVSNGSSAALFLTFAALLNRGDQVILGTPHYSCYPNYITFLDGKPVLVKLYEKESFQLIPENVKKKINAKTKAILINSPSNPTGTVLKPDSIKKISKLGPVIISDEIYHGLSYGKERSYSLLEFTNKGFVLGGFSKLYAMTGWRIGYVIAPKEFIRPMQKIQQSFQISPNSIAQQAAIAALKIPEKELGKVRAIYAERRKLMLDGLRQIGFKIPSEPAGAFYVFASCRFLDSDSYRLAFKILNDAKVAVTPGIDFGKAGEGFLRFSYTTSPEKIEKGLKRLERFVVKLGGRPPA